LAKWKPELRLSAFKVSEDDSEILVEELAEIIYDFIASSENSIKASNLTESKLKKEEKTLLERTGSDG